MPCRPRRKESALLFQAFKHLSGTEETDGRVLVYGPEGALLALGQIRDGVLSSEKNFFEV